MKDKNRIAWNRREDISIKEIIRLYFDEKMSCMEIANKFNCGPTLVGNRIISRGMKLRSFSEAKIIKPTRYWQGKKCPKEMVEKNSAAKVKWWNENKEKPEGIKLFNNLVIGRGKENNFYGKKHTKESRKIIKEKMALQIFPMRDSLIELKIQGFLKQLNIDFTTHNYIKEITHAYQCDIFINPQKNFMSEKKTIIEVDGDYWHGNPTKFPNPNEMQKAQIEEDACRTEELKLAGFEIIRLWENDIKNMNLVDFKDILNSFLLSSHLLINNKKLKIEVEK